MRLILNIEKRYVYIILSFVIILIGIVAVYAFTNPTELGNPPVMGHGASEVGAGYFTGDSYEFPKELAVGVYAGTPGYLRFRSGNGNVDKDIIMRNNGAGALIISDGVSNYFSVSKTEVNLITGATLNAPKIVSPEVASNQFTLRGVPITTWPTALSPQCVFCASPGVNGLADYVCGNNWPIFTGQVDGGNNDQVTLAVECASYLSTDDNVILKTMGGQPYYFKNQPNRANLCCR